LWDTILIINPHPRLKDKLKNAGLKTAGRKQDLVERLQEYIDNGGKVSEEEDDEEESDEEEEPKEKEPKEKEEKKKDTKKRKADTAIDEDEGSAPKKSKVVNIKVDKRCGLGGATVFENWGVTLNQTNIKNNNNKFYVIQVLNVGKTYYCYTRWGRVGENGQNSSKACANLEAAKKKNVLC